jgi:hypothetical protein
MFCCFIDCEFNIGHFFWDCIQETSATLISNQQQDKTEVVNEIDKWKRSMNQSSGNINTSELFEKKFKEKDGELKTFCSPRVVRVFSLSLLHIQGQYVLLLH